MAGVYQKLFVILYLFNFYTIAVTLDNQKYYENINREERSIFGEEIIQDVKDPKYINLAQESTAKYLLESNRQEQHRVTEIEKVTTSLVSGTVTTILYFTEPTDCQGYCSRPLYCKSRVWEQPWKSFKQITVECKELNDRKKRDLIGGVHEADSNNPKFKTLAAESLDKFVQSSGTKSSLNLSKIKKVRTQVVAGIRTKIDFEVINAETKEVFDCHSDVWEQSWKNFKEITVTCQPKAGR